MKQKIEEIIAGFGSCSEKADKILSLFPKVRYPEKDGWPPNEIECLFMLKSNTLIQSVIQFFDNLMERKDIKWWIPVSEITEMLGVNCAD